MPDDMKKNPWRQGVPGSKKPHEMGDSQGLQGLYRWPALRKKERELRTQVFAEQSGETMKVVERQRGTGSIYQVVSVTMMNVF